tara:strand:+ start:222 stop:704 length:483 start_codon:yes stop_codon:yes gene_type:complete
MKGQAVLHGVGARDDWETPQHVLDDLTHFNFTIDVAASLDNAVCAAYIDEEENALTSHSLWLNEKYPGMWWCNPPYGRGVGDWIRKALEQQERGVYGVMLLPARTDTKWFHMIYNKPGIQMKFLKGRLKFEINGCPIFDESGKAVGAPFPSMLVYFGPVL